MSANEAAAAALLSVLVGFPALGLIGWLVTKPRKNRYKRGME